MTCPTCNGPSSVVDSRRAADGAAVRRRRECRECGRRFTTEERVLVTRLWVEKRDGTRQPFDSEKLRAALVRAAHKRAVPAGEIGAIVRAVEAEATALGGVVDAKRIGQLCLDRLRAVDHGAYLQFAGTLPDITPEFAPLDRVDSVRTWVQSGQPR